MQRNTGGFQYAEESPMAPLEDDCKLLASLLDGCLKVEIGDEQFHTVELLRGLAASANMLTQKKDQESAQFLSNQLIRLIQSMPLKQAVPVARACGHYLNLTAIAEMHHRVRQRRTGGLAQQSFDSVFAKILSKGVSREQLYETVCQHNLEIVLTAHPTHVVRRSMQYKLAKIAALLEQNDRPDLTAIEKDHVVENLIREISAVWQTQEFRTWHRTPTDEARGGLNVVEQSLWGAVPSYVRRLNAALKKATGRELPLRAKVVRFASWMGGDREGNPSVTADVTREVAYLARWMAVDLYLKEIDALRFELSMSKCTDTFWRRAKKISEKHSTNTGNTIWEADHELPHFSVANSSSGHFICRVTSETLFTPNEAPIIYSFENKPINSEPLVFNKTSTDGSGSDKNESSIKLPQVDQSITRHSSDQEIASPLSNRKKQTSKNGIVPSESQNKLDELLNPIRSASLHEGSHPYRLVLGDVRHRLVSTKRQMESRLVGTPSDVKDCYESSDELLETLCTVHASLKESGAGVIANGRLLDVIRRVNCFGLSLMNTDIRQEAQKHVEAMDEITTYLELGSYTEWSEKQRIEFLTKELCWNRPLIPMDMSMTRQTKEIIETFLVTAELGPSYLGAYVISNPVAPSDVLLVELFQREAAFILALQNATVPDFNNSIRVVPMFDTLTGLESASKIMKELFSNNWYRQHIKLMHGDAQEVMLSYGDSGKDACRLSVTWALYKCQEQLVDLCKEEKVALTVLYGRGGCMGRGGGAPMWLAIQSQPPGAINGRLRMIEQGEVIQAKFGVSSVAEGQLETCASSLLLATLCPSQAPRHKGWRNLMESLSSDSRSAYRHIIDHPKFENYFHHATPEVELSAITLIDQHWNNDRHPETIKSIPWIFAWTQTRLVFPSWLGFGSALQKAIDNGQLGLLQNMYRSWPLFHSTVDLIEMILAKVDPRIATVYDESLVEDTDEKAIGLSIRESYDATVRTLLMVTGHRRLCDHNPLLQHLLSLRNSFLDPINILQVQILRELREKPGDKALRDALMITINGIAAGMRNTG